MPVTLGKLCPETLTRLIKTFKGAPRREVVAGAMLGRDCGLLDFGESLVSVTCDPITGTTSRAGSLAVHVVANDLVASGAEPVAILVSMIFPPSITEMKIEGTIREVDQTARSLGIAIAGGHTEISSVVNRTLIQCTGLGRLKKAGYPDVSRLQPGDWILMTKTAGVEGTALLAEDREQELAGEMSADELDEARNFFDHLSIVPEGRIAALFDIHSLHDVTEGGVVGAVWEVCAGQQLGFTLREDSIPVHPLTERICRMIALDPLKLISSGTLLIFTACPDPLVKALSSQGIPVACIGTVEADPRHRVIIRTNEQSEVVSTCPQDELWKTRSTVISDG